MTRFSDIAAIVFALSALVACTQSPSAGSRSDDDAAGLIQGEYCETQELAAPEHCKPGQRIVFLPSRFGNEQLPVLFAAANCDLRYSVVITNGGVACVFIRVVSTADAPTKYTPGKG